MADVDIGILIYDLKNNEFFVAGQNSVNVDQLLTCAKQKKISFRCIDGLHSFRTKFSRIFKLMNYGFKMNPTTCDIRNVQIMWEIIVKSFHLPCDYESCHKISHHFTNGKCCMCKPSDIHFVTTCLNVDAYEFAKLCYKRISVYGRPCSEHREIMIAYALCARDIDYAILLLNHHNCSSLFVEMRYLPMILRQYGDFDVTVKIFQALNAKSILDTMVAMFCGTPAFKLRNSFTVDAIYSGDIEYYNKLISYDPKFDIENIIDSKFDILECHEEFYKNILRLRNKLIVPKKLVKSDDELVLFI